MLDVFATTLDFWETAYMMAEAILSLTVNVMDQDPTASKRKICGGSVNPLLSQREDIANESLTEFD